MAMARDGLLPSFFSEVHRRTHVPVNGTVVTGMFIATLAFLMDVSQLAGMVSVGTLLAFTAVAISVLILRYVPPSLPVLIDSISVDFSNPSQETDPFKNPLIQKHVSQGNFILFRVKEFCTRI
jgi:cationic amino acid transporter 1